MLPAYLANMSPIFGKYIFSKQVMTPIDFGIKIKGQPLFGTHKTIGGFLFGIIIALLIGFLQFILYPHIKDICLVDYRNLWVEISFLLGLGAMSGDLAKSFFKRRLNIKPGKPWVPFDEFDFAIGALILASPAYFPGWLNAALILAISTVGHVLIDWIGYFLKIRKKKEIVNIQSYLIKIFKKRR
jgi:CDP-2,3-bis-(O-geranylgeranyl)-sn-glycerol synthase